MMHDTQSHEAPVPAIAEPVAALFPPLTEVARLEDEITRALLAARGRMAQGPVAPSIDVSRLAKDLAAFDFEQPQPLQSMVDWTIAQLEQGVTHMTHPRYFGLFNPAPAFPAECGDRIAGAFNPQLASATTSPAAVAIEAHVIAAVAQRCGLPKGSGGHFTSGGSEANGTALVCALTRASPDFAQAGARAFAGPPVFYVSRECHLAWVKLAHMAGIGRAGLKLIATDGHGRLDAHALEAAIAADRRAGAVPVMIAATAGTTNAGQIDPLHAMGEIARREGLWFHVDAAWGGALIASQRLRGLVAGLELADSITIDAHKWLATTMGCGMHVSRHPELLASVFGVTNSFMTSHARNADPYVTTAQWSRRFSGLRLFLTLAAAGWSGYGQHVERAVALAHHLRDRLIERGWSIESTTDLAVVCITPPGGPANVRAIVDHVVKSGRAWISAAEFEGRPVIRACVTHGATQTSDVDALIASLEAAHDHVG